MFFLIFILWASLQLPPAIRQTPVVQQAPDEAASLIARCGRPDAERFGIPGHPTFGRSLTYGKAHIIVTFVPATPNGGWKLQSTFDYKTSKPVPLDRIKEKLPCLLGR
jgi:hypothetical protein